MRRLMVMIFVATHLLLVQSSYGQTGLSGLPGYDRYQKVNRLTRQLALEGRVRGIKWSDDGESMTFSKRKDRFIVNLTDMSIESCKPSPDAKSQPAVKSTRGKRAPQRRQTPRGRAGRAQQVTWVTSPDGKWIARYRDYNVVLERVVDATDESPETFQSEKPQSEKLQSKEPQSKNSTDPIGTGTAPTKGDMAKPKVTTVAVTTSGSKYFRFGTCCWVYGEELFQSSAMWWSPDSRKLVFYEVDERHMRDYYLTGDNTEVYTRSLVERYPKPGSDNPVVGLLVYDLESKQTRRINVGADRTQYVYNIAFHPRAPLLLFSRTNRRQDTLEVVAADLTTGDTHVVVTERQSTWQANKPTMRFLDDGPRFIWETERTLWKHFEVRHLDGRRLNQLSAVEPYPTEAIVKVDEKADWCYYSAYSGANPNNAHLHRVRLDGTEHRRLTSRALHHSGFSISPDHKWFVACYEAAGVPPETALFDMQGKQVAVLAQPDMQKAQDAELSYGELFTFKADDGATDIYGILHKPAHFDPNKKYPLVVSVYGGPSSRGIQNQFTPANARCELGVLIATIANRGTTGRGKAFETATYMKLGGPDIKDQADGVQFLCQRPYVDAKRIGIYGHSYGGYMSALALVKYPELFHVGVAGAPVTDWKNYDTIYTERYMRTPQENPTGYHDGSCLTYAKNLKGKLLLMHGLIDDNVHPTNTWQLIDLFQRENLRFDMLIYPRSKHGLGSGSTAIRWEYLCRNLRAGAGE